MDTATTFMNSCPILEIHNLCHTYAGRTASVFENFSMSLFANELVSVVGASGCGKSTLLHILGGFLTPHIGTTTLDGTPIQKPNRNIGIMFQHPTLFPWLTVGQNIVAGAHMRTCTPHERSVAMHDTLQHIGLSDSAHLYPHELSGGMSKRVELARVLTNKPRVLLLDEPFGALDVQTKHSLHTWFMNVRQTMQLSSILVTHDIAEAMLLSDRIIVLTNTSPSRIVMDIPLTETRDRTSESLLQKITALIKKG